MPKSTVESISAADLPPRDHLEERLQRLYGEIQRADGVLALAGAYLDQHNVPEADPVGYGIDAARFILDRLLADCSPQQLLAAAKGSRRAAAAALAEDGA